MATRPTTLGLENLESRLNLSSLVGTAVVDSFTSSLRSQERAILRTHSRLIDLNSDTGFARKPALVGATAKIATTIPLVATNTDSPAPTLTLTSTTKSITLLWTNNASNATGFRIERSTDGINFVSIATASPTRTSFTDTHVIAGTGYAYRVTVFNKNNSAVGNTATIALVPPPPPVAASLLTDAKNTLTSVTLGWHDNSNNETGFQVYRSTSGSDFTLLTTLKANSKTFTDTGLDSGTQYVYEIAAVNAGGQTFSDGNITATTATPPTTAPVNLTSSNINSTSITLNWTDSATNLSGFRIYRTSGGSNFTLVGNVDPNTTTFTDTDLNSSTRYYYEVSAWNASSNEFSKPISATTLSAAPNAPSTPAFANVTTTALTLSWTANSTNQTGFHIYRSNDGTNFTLVGTTGAHDFAFNDQNLAVGTTYWYNVAAYNAGGETASTTVNTTTVNNNTNQSAQSPSTPANLSFATFPRRHSLSIGPKKIPPTPPGSTSTAT